MGRGEVAGSFLRRQIVCRWGVERVGGGVVGIVWVESCWRVGVRNFRKVIKVCCIDRRDRRGGLGADLRCSERRYQ